MLWGKLSASGKLGSIKEDESGKRGRGNRGRGRVGGIGRRRVWIHCVC